MRLFGLDFRLGGPDYQSGLRAYAAEQDARDRARTSRRRPMSVVPHRVKAFRAAENDDLNYSWTKYPVPINTRLESKLQTLRARSRDVGINTDYGAAFLRLCRDNIIGAEGMQLRVRAAGSREALDEPANRAAQAAFRRWGGEEHCSMSRELAWQDVQRAGVTSWAEDGEAFIRIVKGSAAGKEWPIALHQIDSELCPVGYNRDLPGGRVIRLGIERDAWGRPLAYYFYKRLPQDQYPSIGAQSGLMRIPADEIIHLYLIERPGQARGVPWMAPTLQRQKMLAAYDEAALVNAMIGARKVGIIRTPDGEGFLETSDPDALDEQEETGRQIIDAPDGGDFWRLAPGEDVSGWNPEYPRGEYGSFTSANLQGISSGLGVGYCSLTNDRKGSSYSSGRLESLQEREVWKNLQGVFSRKFCRRVYLEWLPVALMRQQIVVGQSPLPVEREEKLRTHSWQGRRWDWVDPQKDMAGKKDAKDLGSSSVSEIIRESGRDPDEVFQEIRREREQYGDVLGVAQGGATDE